MNLKRHIRTRYIILVFVFVFAGVFTYLRTKHVTPTQAASFAAFDPGNIISDYVMSNYSSMSEAEIQNFLKSKNSCNDTDFSKARTSIRTYHVENGHYVCLADDLFPDSYIDEPLGLQPKPTSGETAAHIIWQAAQDYQINPQVLLVLLQKEQSLITDTWPTATQYRTATGYGCPDTAACDTKYYGFKNQVRNAASLFRTVLNGGWTNYPLGVNYVRYNPNAACGGSNVNIQNLATSALYRYTPYQPNAAALNAGYGTGDGCSAYGNRNFYGYFVDWFGDTHATSGQYELTKFAQRLSDRDTLLGSIVSDINCNIGHDGACVQAFENGVTIYSPQFGVVFSNGAIRTKHLQLGSVDGVLGLPVSSPNCNIGHDGACVQAFENGVIIQGKDTGTWENFGMIRSRYISLGSVDGSLGFPIGPEECDVANTGACTQSFEKGIVTAQAQTGAWESLGSIGRRYSELGITKSPIGLPISDTKCWKRQIDGIQYCVQSYQEGIIIDSAPYGAWENYGKVRQELIESGSVEGKYGLPIGPIEVKNGFITQSYTGGVIRTN